MELTYTSCELCPRMCRVDRTKTVGFCQSGAEIQAARAALHLWEEGFIQKKSSAKEEYTPPFNLEGLDL